MDGRRPPRRGEGQDGPSQEGFPQGSPTTPQFIAEVASNHGQNLSRCRELIRTAAAIGCEGVKFQLFTLETLFAPEAIARRPGLAARRDWELPPAYLPELAAACHEHGLRFFCTPFSLTAVELLEPHVDVYKIASYDLLRHDLLAACAATGRPVVLATGMSTLEEVRRAVHTLRQAGGEDLTLLHCVSAYPLSPEEANLAGIETLRRACDIPAGWSDHSRSPAVIHRAVHRWGAVMVEFHLDLDGGGPEYAAGHCWLPEEIAPVIRHCRTGIGADGSGEKTPRPDELTDRDWRADPTDGLRPLLSVRREWPRP